MAAAAAEQPERAAAGDDLVALGELPRSCSRGHLEVAPQQRPVRVRDHARARERDPEAVLAAARRPGARRARAATPSASAGARARLALEDHARRRPGAPRRRPVPPNASSTSQVSRSSRSGATSVMRSNHAQPGSSTSGARPRRRHEREQPLVEAVRRGAGALPSPRASLHLPSQHGRSRRRRSGARGTCSAAAAAAGGRGSSAGRACRSTSSRRRTRAGRRARARDASARAARPGRPAGQVGDVLGVDPPLERRAGVELLEPDRGAARQAAWRASGACSAASGVGGVSGALRQRTATRTVSRT